MRFHYVNDEDLDIPALHGLLVLLAMFRRRRPDWLGASCFRVFRIVA